jgi:hypothetical protein
MSSLLCMECGEQIDSSKYPAPLIACPACGSVATPADLDKLLTIQISQHELRILTIWASNWAKQINTTKPISVILDRLGMQTSVPLSLEQEFADIRAEYGPENVRFYDANGNEIP